MRRGLARARVLAVLLACGGAALALACREAPRLSRSGPVAEWPAYGGSHGGESFSPLTQITPGNVRALAPAWVYHTGDVIPKRPGEPETTFEATPIVVDGGLYFCTPFNRVIALDAATGEERWTYDPGIDRTRPYQLTCRGVSTWLDPERSPAALCKRTIFTATLDARLIALDAASGQPCPEFGASGEVALSEGLGPTQPNEYAVTSPPLVTRDLVVTGSLVLDNIRVDAPGGVVRAYDARSGALRWAWDPVPAGEETASRVRSERGDRYRRGTPNAWSILSADDALGLIYVPTGSSTPDYFGGQRGDLDTYASSVVALRSETGEVAWHFPTVHHDLWDYDVASQPALFLFRGAGAEPVPALLQATKVGHVFWLDRRSGAPLFPVEERPVPQGAAPGEFLSPTQPFPTLPPPLHRGELAPEDAYGLTPWDRRSCQRAIAALRYEGPFTPPSLQGTLHYPGAAGGANWGGVAIDSVRGVAVLQIMEIGNVIQLIPREQLDARIAAGESEDEVYRGLSPQRGTPYALRREALLSPLGIPCTPPPWGSVIALDLRSGDVLWRRPLGTTRDNAPWPIWFEIGTPMLGGPIATASGLVFIAATTDDYLRALSTATGEELWRGRLPAGGQSTPMTYRVRGDARQFVVVAAGGHAIGTRKGDALVAFALPAPRVR